MPPFFSLFERGGSFLADADGYHGIRLTIQRNGNCFMIPPHLVYINVYMGNAVYFKSHGCSQTPSEKHLQILGECVILIKSLPAERGWNNEKINTFR